MKAQNGRGDWVLNFLHLKWVLSIHQHIPTLAVCIFFSAVVLGLFASIGIYQHTHSSTLGALGLWFFIAGGLLALVAVHWFERFFTGIALRKLLHNRTVKQIYVEYSGLKDENLQRQIEQYCAMIIYMDHRFTNEVLYLSCFDRLISLGEFRQKVPQLSPADVEAAQMVRELSNFLFRSHLYDEWVLVGTHPR